MSLKPETIERWVVCRVCLQQDQTMLDIFGVRDGHENISDMLHECGGIPIEDGDKLPDKICSRCVRCLRVAFKFRRTCQRSHDHLSDLLATETFLFLGEDELITEDKIHGGSSTTSEQIVQVLDDDNNIIEDESIKIEMYESQSETNCEETMPVNYELYTKHDQHADVDIAIEHVPDDFEYEQTYAEYEIVEADIEQEIEAEEAAIANADASIDDDFADDVLTSDDEYFPNAKVKPIMRNGSVNRRSNTVSDTFSDVTKPKTTIVKRGRRKARDKPLSYICDVCGNIYAAQARLTEHMKFHSGVKPHKCEICGRGFVQNQQLVRHMNTHTGKRPYKCNYCPAAFADRSTKTKHHRIHTKERPYECDVCQKTFTYSDNLKFHKMIHTGEKPHTCDVCGKGFTKAYKMRLHRQTHEKHGLVPPTNIVKTEIISG